MTDVDLSRGPVEPDLDVTWIHGAPPGRPGTDPPLQGHHVDEHTVILRQSKALTYEAPFLNRSSVESALRDAEDRSSRRQGTPALAARFATSF